MGDRRARREGRAVRATIDKVLAALATDPVTGDPLPAIDMHSLVIGLIVAVPTIIGMIALILGVGR